MGKRPIFGMLGLACAGIALATAAGCGECCRNTRPDNKYKNSGAFAKPAPLPPPPMIGDAKSGTGKDFDTGKGPSGVIAPASFDKRAGGLPPGIEPAKSSLPVAKDSGFLGSPTGTERRETIPPATGGEEKVNIPPPPFGGPRTFNDPTPPKVAPPRTQSVGPAGDPLPPIGSPPVGGPPGIGGPPTRMPPMGMKPVEGPPPLPPVGGNPPPLPGIGN